MNLEPALADRPTAVRDHEVSTGAASHVVMDPSIFYFGTPVALISTRNADGTPNLMPMSSSLFLGHTGVLGFGTRSQTAHNLIAERECVINLASVEQVSNVDALALTTGRDPVPAAKAAVGYRHVADKFARARLTPVASDLVGPPRVAECPIALEARVVAIHPLEEDVPDEAGSAMVCEMRIVRTHVHDDIRADGYDHRIDPQRWRPLIMNFQQFFGLGGQVHPSRLAGIDEEWYR